MEARGDADTDAPLGVPDWWGATQEKTTRLVSRSWSRRTTAKLSKGSIGSIWVTNRAQACMIAESTSATASENFISRPQQQRDLMPCFWI